MHYILENSLMEQNGWIKEPFDVYSSYMFVYYGKNTGNEVTICTSSESLIEEIIT